jgi:glycogen synthase kinase 3 beta
MHTFSNKRSSNIFTSKNLSFKNNSKQKSNLETAETSKRVSKSKAAIPQLTVIKQLGRGCFGVVFQAILKGKRDIEVAWKRMHKNSRRVSREFEMLEALKGDLHCVQMLDFFYTYTGNAPGRDNIIQNFVMELCCDSLESLLSMKNKGIFELSYKCSKKVIFQVLLGLKQLHDKSICHRDLKPENIFYRNNVIKIGDLGSSKQMRNFEENTPYVVSRYYRAPELILGIKLYSLNIDIFSVGVIFYELITGHLPFKGSTEGAQLLEIFKHLGPPTGAAKDTYRILVGWHGSLHKGSQEKGVFVNHVKKENEDKQENEKQDEDSQEKEEEDIFGAQKSQKSLKDVISNDVQMQYVKTIPRNSKRRTSSVEYLYPEIQLANEKLKETTFSKEELSIPMYKKQFLECKKQILTKSRISPLWSEDFELLLKIMPHRFCFDHLSECEVDPEEMPQLVE